MKGRNNQDRLVYKEIPYTPDSPQSEAPSTLMGFLALLDPELAKNILGPSYLDFLNMVSTEMELMKRNISIVDIIDTDNKEVRGVTRREFTWLPLFMVLDRFTQVIPYISDSRLPTERVILSSFPS